jgi:hypothetical protein
MKGIKSIATVQNKKYCKAAYIRKIRLVLELPYPEYKNS